MLKGLEISEVSLSDLEFTSRLDPEYYRKEFIISESTLKTKKHERLEVLANFLIGPFGSSFDTENYEVSETASYRYIRGRDVKPYFLMNDDSRFLPEQDFKRLEKYSLKENDILISVVGTLGNACIILKNDVPAIFSNKSTVLRNITVNPYYILTYLNCKYGKNLLLRKTRGAIQTGLNLDDLKSLDVPTFSKSFQQQIEDLVKSAHSTQETSKTLYQEAENLLLSELGIDESVFKVTKNEVVANVKSFADFENSWRLDAEYYQPKYEILETVIYNYGFVTLSSIITNVSTGFPYESANFCSNGIPLIRISNISKNGLNLNTVAKITSEDAYLSPKDKAEKGDVLISMSGSIGLSCVIREEIQAFVNQRIMKFRPNRFDADVLSLIINSEIVRKQLERVGTGGVQTNLSITDILNVKIPNLSILLQEDISNKIQESFSLKTKSEQLLSLAKRAVEIAIEEGEEVAVAWVRENE